MHKSNTKTDTETIGMSDRAIKRVAELIFEEQDLNLKLRVYITGGGCSGLQYGFSFEKNSVPDDTEFFFSVTKPSDPVADKPFWPQKISLIVDPLSLPYLMGAMMDYEATLKGSYFSVKNPNAQSTCGCGSSFSIE